MSKHVNPATELSPKVKAAAVTALVVLGGAVASAIAAIPDEAWEGLGVWAGPVGVFVGGLGVGVGAILSAYQKGDPLREYGAAAVQAKELPPGLPHPDVVPDELTAEADALAARAAELRRR